MKIQVIKKAAAQMRMAEPCPWYVDTPAPPAK